MILGSGSRVFGLSAFGVEGFGVFWWFWSAWLSVLKRIFWGSRDAVNSLQVTSRQSV